MNEVVHSVSPIRQTATIAAIAVLLSFTITGSLYLLFFGLDGRFWQAMTMAIVVPWGISIPLGFHMSKQRYKLIGLTNRLKDAQMKLREANKKLELRANFDGMTGLLDVDHFKNINDSFGHPVGDQALNLLGKIFRKILRKNDIAGRIGGEEFGIFLPDTSAREGQIIGEMVRYEIENLVFEPYHNMRHVITVSIGVTDIAPHQERSALMENADAALFAAKRRGRNQVVMFEPGMRAKPTSGREKPQDLKLAISDSNFR